MPADSNPAGHTSMPFEAWKIELRTNCQQGDKLTAYNALGDFVLKFLWEQGIEPTPEAITRSATDSSLKSA